MRLGSHALKGSEDRARRNARRRHTPEPGCSFGARLILANLLFSHVMLVPLSDDLLEVSKI
jgi:hypothetical protein